MAKAIATNDIAPYVVQRKLDTRKARRVLFTDITYVRIANNRFAYISTYKDACTREIVAYRLSLSLDRTFVLETIEKLAEN